jgi:hypothetical protein
MSDLWCPVLLPTVFYFSIFIRPQKKVSGDYYGFPLRDEVSHRGGISSILKRKNLKNNAATNLPVVANKIMTPTARRGQPNRALICITDPFAVENAGVELFYLIEVRDISTTNISSTTATDVISNMRNRNHKWRRD